MTDDLVRELRIQGQKARIDQLKDRIAQLEDTLQFYANKGNWLLPYIEVSPVVIDGGYRARAALAEEKKE